MKAGLINLEDAVRLRGPSHRRVGQTDHRYHALQELFRETRAQRSWIHNSVNVLNCLPKSVHAKAKSMLHKIRMAESRTDAAVAFDRFVETFQEENSKASECLAKDR